MADRDTQAKMAAAQVLGGLYQAISDHTQVQGVLDAMDEFLDADPVGLERGETDWKAMFRDHFGRVSDFIDRSPADDRDSPIVHVDKQVVPAAVINRSYDIVASNQLFDKMMEGQSLRLSESFSTPDDKRRLERLLKANGELQPVLVSIVLPDQASPVFIIASQTDLLDVTSRTGPLITLKVAKATWNPDLVPLLESAYGLTPAEIEVLESLVESGSIADVAVARNRSVRTVRTQLSHIFGKLGLSGQTELALFLATLAQLMSVERRPSDVGADWLSDASGEIENALVEVDGRQVAYLKYGVPDGVPVLMIHSTTPPDMTPDFRKACADAGLRVMAVHKPGSGGSSDRPSGDGPRDLARDYAAVLKAEGCDAAYISGHCSGGLYALQFANAYPDQSLGVVLIDTGVPFVHRDDLKALPKGIRRTFIPARYIPEVLLVPHQIFAANFKRSDAGEASVVDYFFQDSPIDQQLTRTDRTYYEITRRIIEYSFEDVGRLVADVRRWARDWSDLLRGAERIPLAFVHGSQNTMFSAEKIDRWVRDEAKARLFISEGMAQLQIYQNPKLFIDAVESLSRTD